MSLFAVKIIECHDWSIIEGDTKPAYDMRFDHYLYESRAGADVRAADIETERSSDPSFAAAAVVEMVERGPAPTPTQREAEILGVLREAAPWIGRAPLKMAAAPVIRTIKEAKAILAKYPEGEKK